MQLFQSHLYGIERGLLHDNGLSGHGFNRTFMELKDICQLSVYVKSKFQSHLYGIESWQNKGRHSGDGAFQSHLYGIESLLRGVLLQLFVKFQSHLYGIERR